MRLIYNRRLGTVEPPFAHIRSGYVKLYKVGYLLLGVGTLLLLALSIAMRRS